MNEEGSEESERDRQEWEWEEFRLPVPGMPIPLIYFIIKPKADKTAPKMNVLNHLINSFLFELNFWCDWKCCML